MSTRGRTKDAGARPEREITLKDAAELTGCSGKVLRRLIREGRLQPMSMEGNRMTVTLAALRDAGLLPTLGAEGRGVSAPPPVAGGTQSEDEDEEEAGGAQARIAGDGAATARAETDRVEQQRAAAERAVAARVERERAERERAERERVERERAERERADHERAAKARVERDRADVERIAREHAESERAERARADAERAQRERLEAERAERERAEQAEKVVPMHRVRPAEDDPASEGVDDAADADDFDADADPLGDAEDAQGRSPEVEERETVRILPADDEPEAPRLETLEGEVQPRLGSASLMVTGAPSGPFITAAQIHELLRLLLSEREAKSNEWQERAENLYREIIESQKARIAQLEREKQELEEKSSAQVRDVQGRLEGTLRMVPQGVDLGSLEQLNKDLRIELERREVQKSELERERDRLRDLVERLKNDLSRSERRNLDLAETLRKLRAMGPVDRFLGREPD
jgi:DNA repair exonuclease SbcCD ATPase subunit